MQFEKTISKWRRLSSKTIFEHPRLSVLEDIVELPNGTQTTYLRFAESKGGVTIICLKDNKILLQREYSYPVDEVLFQLPGGRVEDNEPVIEAARRELLEESSLEAQRLEEIGWYFVNNRRSNAKMHVIIAQDTNPSPAPGQPDPEEQISSAWVSIPTFEAMITKGEIMNYSVLAAWAFYKAGAETVRA